MLYASKSYLKAMVLAAGVGTRLDPLTAQLPKPLVPIANKPVMEYILRLLADHGFTQIAVNLHHLPELIENHFGDGSAFDVKLNYLLEIYLSGDAGGVRACREFLQEDTFLVIMGDLLTNVDLSYLLAQHKKKGALATIALKPVEDVSQFGVAVLDENGWIKEFQEKPARHEVRSNLVSTGIYIFEPDVFHFIPKGGPYGFGKQLFPELVKQQKPVLGVPIEDYWSDVGTFDQYRQANFDALSGKIDTNLTGVQTLPDGQLLLGNNSVVKPGAKISGSVIIGNDCVVEEGAVIEDTIIWSGSHIGSRAQIKKSVIGLASHIESGKELNEVAFAKPRQLAHSEPPSKFPSTTSSKKG